MSTHDLASLTRYAASLVAAVMDLASRNALGYLAPSQEWVDDHGDPLPDGQQNAADHLQRAGMLPEFDELFPATSQESRHG